MSYSYPPTMCTDTRRGVWGGTLELYTYEKPTGPPADGQKIPRLQVPCSVSSYVMVNEEPEVEPDGWPSNLITQMIPMDIVRKLGGTYLVKDVKTVLFDFLEPNGDEYTSLKSIMESGYAGCVHFTGAGMQKNACNIKVLILLYCKDGRTFLGFIPKDQVGFVDRIRSVLLQEKERQQGIEYIPLQSKPVKKDKHPKGKQVLGGLIDLYELEVAEVCALDLFS